MNNVKLEALQLDEIESTIKCPHQAYCPIKQFGHINCLNEETMQTCSSFKFYERYPNYEQMFIGSKV